MTAAEIQLSLAANFHSRDFHLYGLGILANTADSMQAVTITANQEPGQIEVTPKVHRYLGYSAVVPLSQVETEAQSAINEDEPLLAAFISEYTEIDKTNETLVYDQLFGQVLHRTGLRVSFDILQAAAAETPIDQEACYLSGRDIIELTKLMRHNFYDPNQLEAITGRTDVSPTELARGIINSIAPGKKFVRLGEGRSIDQGFRQTLSRNLNKLERPRSKPADEEKAAITNIRQLVRKLASIDNNPEQVALVSEDITSGLINVRDDYDMTFMVAETLDGINDESKQHQFVEDTILGLAKYLSLMQPNSPAAVFLMQACQRWAPTAALATLAKTLDKADQKTVYTHKTAFETFKAKLLNSSFAENRTSKSSPLDTSDVELMADTHVLTKLVMMVDEVLSQADERQI